MSMTRSIDLLKHIQKLLKRRWGCSNVSVMKSTHRDFRGPNKCPRKGMQQEFIPACHSMHSYSAFAGSISSLTRWQFCRPRATEARSALSGDDFGRSYKAALGL